jgi:hypothetical protein
VEQIIIRVKSKEKAIMLSELLASLDFVESVNSGSETEKNGSESISDFFTIAGIWEGRNISLESIRHKAWPRQQ